MNSKTKLVLTIVLIAISNWNFAQCFSCEGSNTGAYANAMGFNNTALGAYSSAFGLSNQIASDAVFAVALGSYNNLTEGHAVAIGRYLNATGTTSMIIGAGHELMPLTNPFGSSLMVGFSSNLPTFFVGCSNGEGTTGQVGIGNTGLPLAKLHLRADEGEEASFFIEPNSWSGGDFANLFLGNFYHGITADTNQGLHFLSQKNYLFGAGNMGLGVEEPKAKLHVDGDILFESAMQGFVMKSEDGHCWKGIISNTGILEFQEVDCTTFNMAEERPETEHNGVFVYPNPSNGSFVVEYTGNKNELRLEVTSVNGALLGTYPIQKGINTIALPEISQQLVVVTAYTTRGKLVSAHKIMVSR